MLDEVGNRACLLTFIAEITAEHFHESPLCPVVILWVTGAHFAVPVKRKPNLIQLFAVVIDVCFGRDSRVLSRLNGILFSRKSIGIIAHWVEHIVALQSLEACIDVACNVA